MLFKRLSISIFLTCFLLAGSYPSRCDELPKKDIGQRVDLATHVVVATGVKLEVVEDTGKTIRPALPEPKTMDGPNAIYGKLELQVDEVLYAKGPLAKSRIIFWIDGGSDSVADLRKTYIGRPRIFIMQALDGQDDDSGYSRFRAGYAWYFSDPISDKAKVQAAIKNRIRKKAAMRDGEKGMLEDWLVPSTRIVVARASNLRVMEIRQGKLQLVKHPPEDFTANYYAVMTLNISESLLPVDAPETSLEFFFNLEGTGLDWTRELYVGRKLIYGLRQFPADPKRGLPVRYSPPPDMKPWALPEDVQLVREIVAERTKVQAKK